MPEQYIQKLSVEEEKPSDMTLDIDNETEENSDGLANFSL